MDRVTTETVNAEALAQAQQTCVDVENHRNGLAPKSVKMQEIEFDENQTVYCETSSTKPRPLLPAKFRSKIMQTMHHLDHCSIAETKRRISSEYYWPGM